VLETVPTLRPIKVPGGLISILRQSLTFQVRRPSLNVYRCILVDCEATACHLPFRLTQVSVKRYFPLISCPLYVPFVILVPAATAVLP